MTATPVQTVDVISVGAGPGGLIAGLVAKSRGLETLVIEKRQWVGGTTTQSFGALPSGERHCDRRAVCL